MHKNALNFLLPALLLVGCVTPGYEGQLGSVQSSGQLANQRDANLTVQVFSERPSGYVSLGEVSARRCHRSFVEDAPSLAAITGDLKMAAYAKGGDAISNIQTSQVNGLMANCWYVLEGTATVWKK
jgi:hypothetical protein